MKAIVLGFCAAVLSYDSVLHVVAMTKGIPNLEPRNFTIAVTSATPSTSPRPLGYAQKLRVESFNSLKKAKNLNDANTAPKLGGISCAPTVLHAPSRSSVRYTTVNSSKETVEFHGMKTTQSIHAEIAPKMIASSAAPTVSSTPSTKLERNDEILLDEKLRVYSQLPSHEQPTVSPSPVYENKEGSVIERGTIVYPQITPKMLVSSVAPTVPAAPSKRNRKYVDTFHSEELLIFPKPPYTEKPSVSPPPYKEYEAALGEKRTKVLPAMLSTTLHSTYREKNAKKKRTSHKDDNHSTFPSVSPAPSL